MLGPEARRKFDEIVAETHPQTRAYIAGMGVPADYIDDIAQEAYIAFYQEFEKLPEDVAPIQWLKAAAKIRCLNHFRKQRQRLKHHAQAVAEMLSRVAVSWENVPPEEVVREVLDTCLEKLTERNRKLVELRYGQSLGSDAIARLVSSTAVTVRSMLHRIRAALKECLERGLRRETA